jgi:hypothetical protein
MQAPGVQRRCCWLGKLMTSLRGAARAKGVVIHQPFNASLLCITILYIIKEPSTSMWRVTLCESLWRVGK